MILFGLKHYANSSRFSDHAWRSIQPHQLFVRLGVTLENEQRFESSVIQAIHEHNFINFVRTVRDYNNTGLSLDASKRFCEQQLSQNDGWNRITPEAMTNRLNLPLTSITSFKTEAAELIASRKKINLIKLVRIHTGMGLKESKDFIESFFE